MTFKLDKANVLQDCKKILGEKYILTSESSKYAHRKGYRYGIGEAFAVVKPANLLESWRVIEFCVD